MRVIYATRGVEALVSDVDYARLVQHRWWPYESKQNGLTYVYTQIKRKTFWMHRMITGCPRTMQVDHQDRDGLNNQRPNLRIASPVQNGANREGWGLSGLKGVYRDGRSWRARITYDGELMNLGSHPTKEAAARAYDQKAFELFGEFAFLNFRDEFDLPCPDIIVHDIPF